MWIVQLKHMTTLDSTTSDGDHQEKMWMMQLEHMAEFLHIIQTQEDVFHLVQKQ